MAVKYQRIVAKLAVLAFLFTALNVVTDIVDSNNEKLERRLSYQMRYKGKNIHPYANHAGSQPPVIGYFNLSCPFEWSKYSCAYMQRGQKGQEIVRASTEYYLQNMPMIQAAFDRAALDNQSKRIFFTGDSLMRQLFISIACNAASLQKNLLSHAEIPWKEEWPCHSNAPCFITHGEHGGFDAASIRLVNGMELHFVPHMGSKDDYSSEVDVLERLKGDIARYGRVTFGEKTAMPPGGPNVDVLVYNVGIHYGLGRAKKEIQHFANWIVKPLMERHVNATTSILSSAGYSHHRPRTIYVTTPTQHYNTDNGQWQQGMTTESKQCIDEITSNPRAELEKELLTPGVNVDVLLDYDDLSLGKMHVNKGIDCSHYCMPGVPDVVAARLLEEILV